jgi:Tol biopolymer transport system component
MIVALLLGLAGTVSVAQSRSPEVQFKAAEQKELVQGDLKGAITDYERIAGGSNRALAAQALLRIAAIHTRLGDDEARKVYERLVRQFPDQPDVVRVARARMGGGGSGVAANGILCADCASVDTTMSADGRLIAFMDARSRAIAVRDLTTGQVRLLSTRKQPFGIVATSIMSVISRDGKQVAYLDPEDTPRRLQVIGTEAGATPRTVIERPAKPLAWSSDGRSVLVLIPPDQQNTTPAFGWVSIADGSMREIKTSSDIRPFQRAMAQVALSPDGQNIAYVIGEANGGTTFIHVMRADGSDSRVVNTIGRNWAPIWADGKRLLFLSNRSGKNGLWSIGIADGKAVGSTVEIAADMGDGVITPLGMTNGQYRYVFEQDGTERITIVSVDEGGRKVSGPEEHMLGVGPAWSPDGRYLMFQRRQPGFDRGLTRGAPHFIVIRDMVNGTERTLQSPLGELQPTGWFSDSKAILARIRQPNNVFLGAYRMDVETGETTRLFENQLTDPNSPLMLSRDDKTLYAFRSGVVAKDIATGEEKRILTVEAGRLVPVLSPDGTMWAISRRDNKAQRRYFGITDASGGNLRELYSPPFDMLFEHVGWTPDNKTVLFHQSRAEDRGKPMPRSTFFPNDTWPRQVMRLPIAGGAPEYTGVEVDGWMVGVVTISPNGMRAAYSYIKPVSELRSVRIGAPQ